jgi:hypothetical protein
VLYLLPDLGRAVAALRKERRMTQTWSLPSLDKPIAQAGFSPVKPLKPAPRKKIGRSALLAPR